MSERQTGEACHFCGEKSTASLETHHVVPRRYGGSDEPENLVLLCGTCHNKIEALYDERFYTEIVGESVEKPEDNGDDRTVPANLSVDRMIPPRSPHVQIEILEYFPRIDSPSRKFSYQYSKVNVSADGQHDTVANSGIDSTTRNPAENPRHATPGRIKDPEGSYPDSYRLHCSYCNRVYSQFEHAEIARHLRTRHGIEDPYEQQDTHFSEPEYHSPELTPITDSDGDSS